MKPRSTYKANTILVRLLAGFFLLTATSVACGKSDAPAASAEAAKPEAKKDTKKDAKKADAKKADKKADAKKADAKKDAPAKAEKGGPAKAEATADKSAPEGKVFAWDGKRIAYDKGQWVKYTMEGPKQPKQTFEYKILDKRKEDEYHFEVIVDNPKMAFIQQMWMKIDEKDPNNFKVLEVKMKMGNAPPRTLPAKMIEKQARGMFGRFFGSQDIDKMLAETLDPNSDKVKDVTTPAGTFKSCRKVNTQMKVMEQDINNNELRHTSVPITMLVQSDSVKGDFSMKLVGFGLTGAKASF